MQLVDSSNISSSKNSGDSRRIGGLRDVHAITGCIFLCTLACYYERMGFSIAFTVLADSQKLNSALKGTVMSAFFCGYAVMQLPGGWLAARYGGARILGLSFALWGTISLLMPGNVHDSNTNILAVCRVGIGASQGLFIPASHTLLAKWIPVHERSRLVTLAMSGMYLGSACAMLFVPYIVKHFGSYAQFKASGLLALAWLAMWSRVGSDQPQDGRNGSGGAGRGLEPMLVEESAMEAVPLFNKKDDPTPLLRSTSSSSGGGVNSTSRGSRAESPSSSGMRAGAGGRSSSGIPWGILIQSPAVWAIVVNNFAFHYATYVLMNWLPTYFQQLVGVGLSDMSSWYTVQPHEHKHHSALKSLPGALIRQKVISMAPKGKSKKDKDSTTGKKKKAKPGLDGQKPKKSAKAASSKKKAWGKDKGKNEDDAENEGGGRGLKPVRIKLDQEGRDAILDILHQLHVDGAEDGAKDDDDDDDDSEDDEEEEEEEEEEEGDNNTNDDDSGEEEDGSDAVEIDDSDGDGDVGFPATQGHGDFEYDGTFGDMANLMSDLVVNETALPTNATNGGETKARDRHGGSPTTSKKLPGSDEPGAGSRSEQGRSTRKKDTQASTSSGKTPQQALVENTLLGGSGSTGKSTSSAKKALRSNVTREKLLASMVQEDRKHSKQERPGTGGVPSAAIVAASTVGGGSVGGGSGGYRRPDPPGAGTGNDKVRLEVCAEKKKTGAPDLNGKKLMVFSRREPIQEVLDTCRGKLHMKKKAKGAALLEGKEVVDWLSDLSWVPNGAVVLISCNGAPGSKRAPPPPRTQGSAASAGLDAAVDGDTPAIVGEGEGPEQAEKDVEEDEEEALALAALSRIRESYKMRTRGRRSETGRVGTGESAEEAGKRMAEARRAKEGTAQFRKMMAQRQSLPAYSQREDIVRTIRDNQVVVLSGETGCGKTTQVPQFVLDGLIDQGQGGGCNIVCTQPRRISAVGVADRVASERCESVGGTVGYQIRLDSRVGPSTRLTFCTTGILLRRLTSDGMLAGVSHIMVDEVHERDLQTDFLLSILRDLLPKRPELRVVLMSATLQADLFTKYFNSCPAITIPGRTFPVEITYLDSVNRLVRGPKAQTLMPRVSSGPEAATGRGNGSARANSGGRGTGGKGSAEGGGGDDDAMSMAYDPLTGEPLESTSDRVAVSTMVSPKCEDKVDYDIMVDLIDHIMSTKDAASGRGGGGGGGSSGGGGGRGGRGNSNDKGRSGGRGNAGRQGQRRDGGQPNSSRGAAEAAAGVGDGEPLGAILVFLPGFAEIDQLVRALERHPRIGRGSRVFPLHSSLPPQQQKSIFQRMPPGVRKIVVSTNIAETSVTIDDCTHVIDAGRVREMRYDPITRMSCLLEVWISKASGSQRAGRAGRVRPGKCWRLYPQAFHEINMPTHTLAEMLRTPLEELVLQVLLLELGSPAEFLARAVEPPPPKMLRAALRNLYDLQAIVISKSSPILTPLGYHLAQLPMDARVGKLLLVAATLQCLDPILTIAAALSDKAPFQRPFGEQGRADAARQQFAQHKSDHLAIVDAFSAWRNKRRTCSYSEVRRWCREMFLSPATLERLDSIRQQFRQQLCEVGFAVPVVPNNRASGRDAAAAAGGGFGADNNNWRNKKGEESKTAAASEKGGGPTPQDSDKNAGNIALVQSVLVAGLYPHVAAFRRPNSKLKMRKGHFITRDDVEPAFVHPSSVNHQRFSGAAESGRQVWIVYHSKMKTKQVYLQDSTYATPFSLMLWGARVRHERPLGKKHAVEVVIDRWLRFRMTESTAVAFKAMRRELSNLLVRKIEAPHEDTGPLSGLLVSCLGRLLEIESRNPYNT